ncbi:MAG: DUF2339 domain-containing protein, partial [Burkholderiales bacterium]|nr:DUF2339 domain-containing protein [Burkholderiales bacterium]
MNLLFALMGAVLGGLLGQLSATLCMVLLGAVVGWRWWSARAGHAPAPAADFDAPTLLRRVLALEREVNALRRTVADLPDSPLAGDAARPAAAPAADPMAPVPRSQTMAPAAAAPGRTPAPEPARVADKPAAAAPATAATALRAGLATAHAAVPATAPARRPVAVPAPAVPLRDRLPPWAARWIFGGNTIVKAGVLILFLGLAFLLRYTAERVTVPIELRYAGVALVGGVLTALGWRLRDRRDAAGGSGYGVILQGAGTGIFYLTSLAALRLDPLLSPELAFAFMAAVAVFGALLAVLQDAPWLAFVSVAEGFAAPALVSTGSDAYVPLMAYMAILDAGILAIAWFKAWRPLNLVGAAATFALAAAWAQAHYLPSDYAGVQAFLVLFFLLFTVTGVLFARRALALGDAPDATRPLSERAAAALRQVGRVDSTLTFGVPLAAFSLQYLLVRDTSWGPAWSAAAFALFHILLGGALMRRGPARYALLGEAHVIVGSIFGTLAVPLALQGAWTGATWAVEAAGMYWLGARQHRTYARAFALAVMLGAAARLLAGLTLDLRDGVPLVAGSTLGMAMLAAALCAMDSVRRRLDDEAHGAVEAFAEPVLPFAAALTVAALAWMTLPVLWAAAATAWIAFGCAALAARLAAPTLRVASALLHLGALTAMVLSLQVTGGTPAQAHAARDLAGALLIGGALLATGWLGIRDAWREAMRGAPRPIPLGSSVGLVLGLGVASASLLFELAPADAALAWPAIGLAAAWIGLRLRSGALVGSGLVLQLAAGAASLLYEPSVWTTADAGPTWRIPLLLATAGLALGERLRAAPDETSRAWWHATLLQWALVGWSALWWSRTLPPLVWRALAQRPDAAVAWPHWQVIWLTLSMAAAAMVARWRGWRVLGQATLVTVPLWLALALGAPAGLAPSASLGWIAWPLALLVHPWLAREQAHWVPEGLATPSRLAGWWLFLALATRECVLRVAAVVAPDSSWVDLAGMAVPALVLFASVQPAVARRWPGVAWRVAGCGAIALYLFGWLWVSDTRAGNAAPLSWLPLLNPLETAAVIVLLALAAWVRALPPSWRAGLAPTLLPAVGGATTFGLVTAGVLRACHHLAGVPWNAGSLFESTLAQAALSVTWSLVGVGLMVTGR